MSETGPRQSRWLDRVHCGESVDHEPLEQSFFDGLWDVESHSLEIGMGFLRDGERPAKVARPGQVSQTSLFQGIESIPQHYLLGRKVRAERKRPE